MNALTETKPMLLDSMAAKYGLRPQEFADTVRKTCGLSNATAEEFAAFIMVAKEYGLNPLLKEIHAFPRKGGGIVPVVSIDGWVNLVNSHKQCNGFEFEMEHGEDGSLISCTCRMYRKDRDKPVTVTEYFDECYRQTDPWKMKHRMLRHKAMIQAARYAFGFSGIYDEDEGAVIAGAKDVTPQPHHEPPPPPEPEPVKDEIEDAQLVEDETEEAGSDTDFLTRLHDALQEATSEEEVESVWEDLDVDARLTHDKEAYEVAIGFKKNRMLEV